MKKNIAIAQMGGSYNSRRAYKGAGSTSVKKDNTKSSDTKKSSGFGKDMDSKKMSNAKVVESLNSQKKTAPKKLSDQERQVYLDAEAKYDTRQKSKNKPVRTVQPKVASKTKSVDLPETTSKRTSNDLPKTVKRENPFNAKLSPKGSVQIPYTEKEKKIMKVMEKGKKKDGTIKASAQRKIQAIRKKK